jgi:hypothetical protein
MTREQDIRKEILFQLKASRPLALSAATMARQARKAGLNMTETDIKREAELLISLDKLEPIRGSGGEKLYVITGQTVIEMEEEER